MSIPIDPKSWEVITDAMAKVPGPLGTANRAHLQGIDFAGKTGRAQTICNTLKAKLARRAARTTKTTAGSSEFAPQKS